MKRTLRERVPEFSGGTRRFLFALVFAGLIALSALAQELTLPNTKDSFKFAAIGDTGTGGREQYDIGKLMMQYHEKFPFQVVVMMGDNMYGGASPQDYTKKFETPYASLLAAGVKFYASLGNHDN